MIKLFILSFVPLVGTTLGAILGIFNDKFEKQDEVLVAVATGILEAICFSLLLESIEIIRDQALFVGILAGFLFIAFMNFLAHKKTLNTKSKLFWAMLIHNIPEGIIIGIALASKEIVQALSLIFSITLQNVPDGLVVSMPAVSRHGKRRAILLGIISGAVEPIAALLILVSASSSFNVQAFGPFLTGFSFSAIVMITVELIKECKKNLLMFLVAIITIIFNSILG